LATRDLVWDGCVNVRDLGGLPTEDGRVTRFGAVVRADNVRGLSDEGWQALTDYGIRTIVDLRWQHELDADPPRGLDLDLDVVHIPLLEDLDRIAPVDELAAPITDSIEWRRVVYLEFIERFKHRFSEAVTAVANAEEGGVLVHCAGGVDRTGMLAALMLRVARVGIDDIADDYGISERNWAPSLPEWIEQAPDEAERTRRAMLGTMSPRSMAAVISEVEARYGSAAGYLERAGVSPTALDRIRERLVA
jgi:protein-tyrosine phosphatase